MTYDYFARVRVATNGWLGAPGLNTFYFGAPAADEVPNAADCQDAVTRVRAAMATDFKQSFPTTWLCDVDPVVDVLLASTGELQASHSVAAPAQVVGTTSALFGPSAVMLALTLNTDAVVNGHRVRGRSYFGPIAPVSDSNGTPTSTMKTNTEGISAALVPGEAGAVEWGVWHRPVEGAGGSFHPVTSVAMRDRFAVLRSRRG